MNQDRTNPLGALNVSVDEEDVYRSLLAKPGATVDDLEHYTSMGRQRLRGALSELESKAIISRRGGSPIRYQPAPPDVAIEALVSARQEELNRARLSVNQLMTLLRVPPEEMQVSDVVEILTTPDAVAERWMQLQRATHETMEGFVRPPFAEPRHDRVEEVQDTLLDRGVRARAIYDQAAIDSPGVLDHIDVITKRGERARVVSELPLKLIIFDRRTALVPSSQSDPESTIASGLVVHTSALLDALITLFDLYWQRGTDVGIGSGGDSTSAIAAQQKQILTLLAAGFKDEAIGRQVGLSTPTVRRRIKELLVRLGVTTRFQAGLALGREHPDGRWPS